MPYDVVNNRLSDLPAGTLLEHAAAYYPEILRGGAPISRGREFKKYDSRKCSIAVSSCC